MSARFNLRALELAVTEYRVLLELGDPVTPAAFGIAVSHLQTRLNISLLVAAEMLRLEIDRLATLQRLAASGDDLAAQAERAEVLRQLRVREVAAQELDADTPPTPEGKK